MENEVMTTAEDVMATTENVATTAVKEIKTGLKFSSGVVVGTVLALVGVTGFITVKKVLNDRKAEKIDDDDDYDYDEADEIDGDEESEK